MYKNNYIETFAKRLQAVREKKKITQMQLAELLSQRFNQKAEPESWRPRISAWENGKKLPSLEEAVALCEIFKIDLDYLLGKTEITSSQIKEIAGITGLAEQAIEKLITLEETENSTMNAILSNFILNDYGLSIIDSIQKFLYADFRIKLYSWLRGGGGTIEDIKLSSGVLGEVTLTAQDLENSFIVKLVNNVRMWRDEIQKEENNASKK